MRPCKKLALSLKSLEKLISNKFEVFIENWFGLNFKDFATFIKNSNLDICRYLDVGISSNNYLHLYLLLKIPKLLFFLLISQFKTKIARVLKLINKTG